MNSIQQLLESSNQYKVVSDDAKRLSQKWVKSGLLEGIKNETERNTMAVLLENQAKQLVTEANTTGNQGPGAGSYSGESWNGVALPLVRRVFGEIAAKEFVSVQPMNLPSGLVFYLDFKYGTNVDPFTSGGSLYGANASTNVTDIASASLYGGGRFGYSINQTSSIVTGTTGSVSWADVNFDSDYVATGGSYNDTQPKAGAKRRKIKTENIAAAFPGMWSIPGGKLEENETTQEGAKREFFEETALNINDIATLSKEIGKNQEVLSAFSSGNRIQQEAIAKSMGMSREEMANMIYQQQIHTLIIHTLYDLEHLLFYNAHLFYP